MRRAISLSLAFCLAACGAAGLIFLLFFAVAWKGWMVIGAGFLFAVGVFWLWSDMTDTPLKRDVAQVGD
jgi:hypothetical protein